jgi:hypothetical protein
MQGETLDALLQKAASRLPLLCDEPPTTRIVRLGDGGIWAGLPAVGGMTIRCGAGALWVTQPGTPGDVILRTGESFAARAGGGKVVVQALDHGTFWIE